MQFHPCQSHSCTFESNQPTLLVQLFAPPVAKYNVARANRCCNRAKGGKSGTPSGVGGCRDELSHRKAFCCGDPSVSIATFVAFEKVARNSGRSAITGMESTTLTVGDRVGAGDVGVGFSSSATVTPITIATTTTAVAISPHTNARRRRSGFASTNGAASVLVEGSMGSGWMTSSASASSSVGVGPSDNGPSREGRDDDLWSTSSSSDGESSFLVPPRMSSLLSTTSPSS